MSAVGNRTGFQPVQEKYYLTSTTDKLLHRIILLKHKTHYSIHVKKFMQLDWSHCKQNWWKCTVILANKTKILNPFKVLLMEFMNKKQYQSDISYEKTIRKKYELKSARSDYSNVQYFIFFRLLYNNSEKDNA